MNPELPEEAGPLFPVSDRMAVLVVIAFSAIAALAVQASAYPNHDVSYLTWVAHRIWHSAVYGRDIHEINPPLAFLIYSPAALFGGAMGLAVKLWVAAIACLSLATLSRAVPVELRIPVVTALGIFFAFAFPREFGQREQIALLLCAPYAAGAMKSRNWAVLSGAMAGIGFAVKPHFLVALMLVFLSRRRIGVEERTIVIVGLLYAACLLLFFQPYLQFLPSMTESYSTLGDSAYHRQRLWYYVAQLVPALALGLLHRDTRALGLGAASVGFAIAAAVQGKFFAYHFVAAWGFLTLYLAAQLAHTSWRWVGSLLLVTIAAQLGLWALPWFHGKDRRNAEVAALVREMDASDGFTVLSIHPYPAFPAAIYASQPYLGRSAGIGGLGAVGKLIKAGTTVPTPLANVTLNEVLSELDRQPGLVIVQTDWSTYDDLSGFDGLRWLGRSADFRRRWTRYSAAGSVGGYRLFRRTK